MVCSAPALLLPATSPLPYAVMFDIGFSELIVIGVVALVVIGPERLPKVARTAGLLFGRFQRYVSNVKADIQREMDTAEFGKLKNEVQDAARSLQLNVNEQMQSVESQARSMQDEFDLPTSGEAPAQSAAVPATPLPEAAAKSVEATPVQQQLDLEIEDPYSPPSVSQKMVH